MQLLGRSISKWWLLLAIPIVLFGPLSLLIMGNAIAGMIFGPPAIWNRQIGTPSYEDLIGRYIESERRWDGATNNKGLAALDLNRDGSMRVDGLPVEFWPNTCNLSGSGRWNKGGSDEITLTVVSRGMTGDCESGSYSYFAIARMWKPYDLYWIVGDPDSGTSVWLKKQ